MSETKAHVIIIDGADGVGKKTFCFELALTFLYNKLNTALLLSPDSVLFQTLVKRKRDYPNLPTPTIITKKDFLNSTNDYDAIIIPDINFADQCKTYAHTYITLLPQTKTSVKSFQKNMSYINTLWELKKKIASEQHHTLNWVVCENNLKEKNNITPSPELNKIARMYGFRLPPPLHYRKAYKKNISGLSAQDKVLPELKKQMTFDDICAKREIIKLAEFIFS